MQHICEELSAMYGIAQIVVIVYQLDLCFLPDICGVSQGSHAEAITRYLCVSFDPLEIVL